MSQSIEDLVRAAQQEQADRAVDPQRILAALPQRRAQVVRRRRFTLAVAAVAVAAVAAVPVIALRGGPAPIPPSVTPTPSSPSEPAPAPNTYVPLRYKPTWLPVGYQEYYRNSRLEGSSRVWYRDAPTGPLDHDGPMFFLNVDLEAPETATGAQPVDIDGVRGTYLPEGHMITWPGGGFALTVGALNQTPSKATLLRIARSVRLDTEVFRIPFRAPEPPPGLTQVDYNVSGVNPEGWVGEIVFGDDPQGIVGDVSITMGTATRAPQGGTNLRVAGRPARYVKAPSPRENYFLVVELGAGRLLTVSSSLLSQAEMIKLAEGTGPVTAAALPWIGS
ncbi:MAG: hypothetical protein ABW000_24580 [Actinoplanes sp.]